MLISLQYLIDRWTAGSAFALEGLAISLVPNRRFLSIILKRQSPGTALEWLMTYLGLLGGHVSPSSPDSQHDQAHPQRKVLQRAVLLYLSLNGPAQWSDIYTHFERQHNGARVTYALRCLALVKSIAIAQDGLTIITDLGKEQLTPRSV